MYLRLEKAGNAHVVFCLSPVLLDVLVIWRGYEYRRESWHFLKEERVEQVEQIVPDDDEDGTDALAVGNKKLDSRCEIFGWLWRPQVEVKGISSRTGKWYLRPLRLLEMLISRHSCGVPTPMNLHRLQTSINSTHDLVVVSLPEAAISSVNMDTMSSVGRRAVGEVSRVPAEGPRDDSIVRIM